MKITIPLQDSLQLKNRDLEVLLLAGHPTAGVVVDTLLVVRVLPVLLATLGSKGGVALALVPSALLDAAPVLEDRDDARLAVVSEGGRVCGGGDLALVVGLAVEEVILGGGGLCGAFALVADAAVLEGEGDGGRVCLLLGCVVCVDGLVLEVLDVPVGDL